MQNQNATALSLGNSGSGGPVYRSGWAVSTAGVSYQRAVAWTE